MKIAAMDAQEFSNQVELYRRELQAHCYRMMGSIEDAEDMVQETYLRAWRRRDTYRGEASLRAWLYKIATNACLDVLKKQSRRAVPRTYQTVSSADEPIPGDVTDPIWLQPYPDELIPADHRDDPDVRVVEREQISLAFVAVLQLLPPRQRAVLLLRDVLEWRTREVADLLGASESAVKSALFRARSTLAEQNSLMREGQANVALDETLQTQLADYVVAWENADVDALLELLQQDATFSMPPIPAWYRGRDQIRALTIATIFRGAAQGRWRLLPTRANFQPAFGLYRITQDQAAYAFYGIQVLTVQDGLIADVITFRHPGLAPFFKLASTLPV